MSDSMLKLEKEEILVMFRKMQRKADKYQTLFRKCASELWALKHPDMESEDVTQIEYIRSVNEEVIEERNKLRRELSEKKESLIILRDKNRKLIAALKSIGINDTLIEDTDQ